MVGKIPCELTRMSSGPSSFSAVSTAASASSADVTSAVSAMASPGEAAAPRSASSWVRSSAATLAPSRPMTATICEPMRPPAPVTTAFLPSSSIGFHSDMTVSGLVASGGTCAACPRRS
jgi:hypothetical protein